MRDGLYPTPQGEAFQRMRLTALALVASMGTAICLVGATAYTVSQHPFEINVSIALGSHPARVLRIDLRHEGYVQVQ